MTSVEHKVAMHQLATERRKAGQKIWDQSIRLGDFFHNDELTFEQKRDGIVATIKRSRWFEMSDPDEWEGLPEIVANLESSDNIEDFDGWFNDLYDLADYDRVWIETISR